MYIPKSNLSLGTSQIGGLDERRAMKILDQALELGVNLFDTAPLYGNAEIFLGKVLKSHSSHIEISSKWGLPKPKHFDPKTIENSIRGSVERLGGRNISTLFVHSLPMSLVHSGVAETLIGLRNKGLFNRLGYSGDNLDLKRAIESGYFQDYMITINILDQRNLDYIPAIASDSRIYIKRPLANAVWRHWKSQQLFHYLYKIFGAGRAFDTQNYRFRLQTFRKYKYLSDYNPKDTFLKFILSMPFDKTLVVGSTNFNHIEELRNYVKNSDFFDPDYFRTFSQIWLSLNKFDWQAHR